jgi:hypothetical protein
MTRPPLRRPRASNAPGAANPAPVLPPGHPAVNAGDTAGPAGGAAPTGTPSAGGLTWTAPAAFTARAPESRMRAAEYTIAAPGGGEPAVLGVFYFGPDQGGSIDANVERWIGQFTDAAGAPAKSSAKVEKRSRGAFGITTVDVSGTFTNSMPGGPAGAQANQRMLGAIVEGPNGPVFFKLVGPAAAVAPAEAPFRELIDSVH